MSSIVNLDLSLIASKGLLPNDIMAKVFKECLKECHGFIDNNILYIDNACVGKITINDRIIVQTSSEALEDVKRLTEDLRSLFTKRSSVEIKNYQSFLSEKKKQLKQTSLVDEQIKKAIAELEKTEQEVNKAIERQQMTSCEAIVEELKEAAFNQGYDIEESKTENGIQLQFVRRVY